MIGRNVKMSFIHAFYIFGLTFFSTLSTEFYKLGGQIDFLGTCIYCLIPAFISGGLGFFISLGIQNKIDYYKDQERRKKKGTAAPFLNRTMWERLYCAIHPRSLGVCFR